MDLNIFDLPWRTIGEAVEYFRENYGPAALEPHRTYAEHIAEREVAILEAVGAPHEAERIRQAAIGIDLLNAQILAIITQHAADGRIIGGGYPSPADQFQVIPLRHWAFLEIHPESGQATGEGLRYAGLKFLLDAGLTDEGLNLLREVVAAGEAHPPQTQAAAALEVQSKPPTSGQLQKNTENRRPPNTKPATYQRGAKKRERIELLRQCVEEVRKIHRQKTGKPLPEIVPPTYAAFGEMLKGDLPRYAIQQGRTAEGKHIFKVLGGVKTTTIADDLKDSGLILVEQRRPTAQEKANYPLKKLFK